MTITLQKTYKISLKVGPQDTQNELLVPEYKVRVYGTWNR